MKVEELLEARSVCVCAGAGGVGKTTVSAAIAVGMAARGLRVVVVTIDPARRLADSLGMPELGAAERRVEPERLAAAGIEIAPGGELWAMMLDAKTTFDELVERRAPDERTRDDVLSNRIYQQLSAAVAGSQEYMAMEKLYELHEDGRYDLLVLDTPPSRNALDFLDAPDRLARFIDSSSLQFFLAPGMRGLKVLGRGTGVLARVLERVTGIDLLRDLSEFFQSFGTMAGGFDERARRVRELLGSSAAGFLLVTSPRDTAIEEAELFAARLEDDGMSFAGAIVNRVRGLADGDDGDEDLDAELDALLDRELAAKVAAALADQRRLAEHDRVNLTRIERSLAADAPLLCVPHLDDEVHDLAGLEQVRRHLFG